jgi:ParB/RepB/Spo0J family partition protein
MKSKREVRKGALEEFVAKGAATAGGWPTWLETVLLAANKTQVQEALDRLTPADLAALDKAHVEARGDWRRKMIVDARRRLEREKTAAAKAAPEPAAAAPTEIGPIQTSLPRKFLPLGLIEVPKDNHRLAMPASDLEDLQASLRTLGLQMPIRVATRGGEPGADEAPYVLVFGFRRLEAARAIGWQEIWTEVSPPLSPQEAHRQRAVENCQRRDLDPVEEAVAVARLLETIVGVKRVGTAETANMPTKAIEEAAALLGKPPVWVRGRMILLRLAPAVRDLVAARRLPLAYAQEIARLADPVAQAQVAREFALNTEGGSKAWKSDVGTCREKVAEQQRKLSGTRFRLDMPFAGHEACDGCPHNSAVATALFAGVSAKDARCLNGKCFDDKVTAAEKGIARAVADARKKKLPATATEVATVTPQGIKAASVARQFAKETDGGKAKPKGARSSYVPFTETPAGKFDEAFRRWQKDASNAVRGALKKDKVARAVLGLAGPFLHLQTWRYRDQKTAQAEAARAGPVLDRLVRGSQKDLDVLALEAGAANAKRAGQEIADWSSAALAALAKRLGVELKDAPTLEQFQPKAEKQAAAKP